MFQNFNWKRILIVIGFVAIIAIVGFLIYYLFFTAPNPSPAPTNQTAANGQLPSAIKGTQPGGTNGTTSGQLITTERVTKVPAVSTQNQAADIANGGITKVNDIDYTKTTSMTLASNGQGIMTYNPDTGKFYSLDANGNKVALTDKTYKGVENIAWSAQNNEAILQFPDGSNILYDFNADKQITLPKTWTSFDFTSSGDKIAFKDMSPYTENRWLAMANPDGSGQKYLAQMGDDANKFIVNWSPDNKVAAMYKNGGTSDKTQVLLVGQNDENFPALNINGFGFDPKWTPDGSRLLYSASDATTDNKPMLYIVDASGDRVGYNQQSIGLNTWADKCSFSDANTAYCAVPKDLPTGADFAPAIADNTPDYIYKIDLATGVKSFVAEPEYQYTIDQITVSPDQQTLYFTDKATQSVHTIKLK